MMRIQLSVCHGIANSPWTVVVPEELVTQLAKAEKANKEIDTVIIFNSYMVFER